MIRLVALALRPCICLAGAYIDLANRRIHRLNEQDD